MTPACRRAGIAALSRPRTLGTCERSLDIRIRQEPYDFQSYLIDFQRQSDAVRVSSLRGVGHVPNLFAIESFLDELAVKAGKDPIEFRLKLLGKSPRAQAMLKLVATMSGWPKVPTGRARGVCVGVDGVSTVAGMVAEVSLDKSSGQVRVHHFWTAVDPGLAVQPDNIVAQMEGGINQGVGVALYESITIRNGKVQQNNFHDYRVPRITDAPQIEVRIVSTDNPPSGVGELGPLITAAIENAVAAEGARVRHLPLTPELVMRVLPKSPA